MSEPLLFPIPETPAHVLRLRQARERYDAAVLHIAKLIQGGCAGFYDEETDEMTRLLTGCPINPDGFQIAWEIIKETRANFRDGQEPREILQWKFAVTSAEEAYKKLNRIEKEEAKK